MTLVKLDIIANNYLLLGQIQFRSTCCDSITYYEVVVVRSMKDFDCLSLKKIQKAVPKLHSVFFYHVIQIIT